MTNPRPTAAERARWRELVTGHHGGWLDHVQRLLDALDAAETTFADATAYCSGEFPCEASTAAAYLEREVNNLKAKLDAVEGELDASNAEEANVKAMERAIIDGSTAILRDALGSALYAELWGPELERLGTVLDTLRAENATLTADRNERRRLCGEARDGQAQAVAERDEAWAARDSYADAYIDMEQRACRALDKAHALHADLTHLRQALVEIAKGEGEFSRDPLTHATNTIEHMKALTMAALTTRPAAGAPERENG